MTCFRIIRIATSFTVKDSALEINPSNSTFDSSNGIGEISVISRFRYWALSRDDYSKSTILLRYNELQVLEICNSEKTLSNFEGQLSIFFVTSFVFSDKLSKLKSCSISSSLDSSLNLLLVKTTLVNTSKKNIIYTKWRWQNGVFIGEHRQKLVNIFKATEVLKTSWKWWTTSTIFKLFQFVRYKSVFN